MTKCRQNRQFPIFTLHYCFAKQKKRTVCLSQNVTLFLGNTDLKVIQKIIYEKIYADSGLHGCAVKRKFTTNPGLHGCAVKRKFTTNPGAKNYFLILGFIQCFLNSEFQKNTYYLIFRFLFLSENNGYVYKLTVTHDRQHHGVTRLFRVAHLI